jgi:hypothetical protein
MKSTRHRVRIEFVLADQENLVSERERTTTATMTTSTTNEATTTN